MSNEHYNDHSDAADEPFDTQKLQTIVKKAQRKSLLRTAITSTVVFFAAAILLFIGYIIIRNTLNEQGYHALASREHLKKISGPNTYIISAQFQPRLFKGEMEYMLVKKMEDRIIPWGTVNMEYSIFGTMSKRFGSHEDVQIYESNGTSRVFNKQTGERELLFYHPSLPYTSMINDLTVLPAIPNDKYIEIGLSFDKSYALEEVERLLPDEVHVTWYWVNTMDAEELAGFHDDQQPLRAETSYGFDRYRDGLTANDPAQKQTEEDFIRFVKTAIEQKDYYISEYQRIYNAIEKNKKDGLIIGAVVTGTRESLLTLKNQPFIRAAVLGATVDQF